MPAWTGTWQIGGADSNLLHKAETTQLAKGGQECPRSGGMGPVKANYFLSEAAGVFALNLYLKKICF